MEYKNDLDVQTLRSFLHYDPETGIFRWKSLSRMAKRIAVGDVAGTIVHGYRRIRIHGEKYGAHRLAWLYVYGEWPKKAIDHINMMKDDNRLSNLREANWSQNCAHTGMRRHNKTGLKGVSLAKYHRDRGRIVYKAQIQKNGKVFGLGYFSDPLEAHRAYLKAAKETHGEFCHA